MSESIVVIAGPAVAAAVGLPVLSGTDPTLINDPYYSKVLSPKEYGNYLPDFWKYIKNLAVQAASVEPSLIHRKIAERGWPVITQNIGGVHLRAGSYPVVEVYGQLFKASCLRCQTEVDFTIEDYEALGEGEVPACGKCGKKRMRPSVVLPGEHLKHRRLAEDFVSDATLAIFLGVEPGTEEVERWMSKAATKILVSPERWGSFDRYCAMDARTWALNGCPMH